MAMLVNFVEQGHISIPLHKVLFSSTGWRRPIKHEQLAGACLRTLSKRATSASCGAKCSTAARMALSHSMMSWRIPYFWVRKAYRCCSSVSRGCCCWACLQGRGGSGCRWTGRPLTLR